MYSQIDNGQAEIAPCFAKVGIISGSGNFFIPHSGIHPFHLFPEPSHQIINPELRFPDQIGMDRIMKRLIPVFRNSFFTNHCARNASGRGRGAIVIQSHGDRLADDFGKILFSDRDAPNCQTGIVDRMDSVHAAELFINGLPGLPVISNTGRLSERPSHCFGQGAFLWNLRETNL